MSRYIVKNAKKSRKKAVQTRFGSAQLLKGLLDELHIEFVDALMQRNVVVFEAENGLDALRDLEFELCVCLAAFDGNADLSVAGINVTACII